MIDIQYDIISNALVFIGFIKLMLGLGSEYRYCEDRQHEVIVFAKGNCDCDNAEFEDDAFNVINSVVEVVRDIFVTGF